MTSRDAMRSAIEAVLDARRRGDTAEIGHIIAPDATYEIAGESSLMGTFPVGPGDARDAVATLIDLISYHKVDIVDLIVDGNRAMTLSRVSTSVAGGEAEDMLICGVWSFNRAGQPESLIEFTDTARLAQRFAAVPARTITLVAE